MQLGPQLLVLLLEVFSVGDGRVVGLADGIVFVLELPVILDEVAVVVLDLPDLVLQPRGLVLADEAGYSIIIPDIVLPCSPPAASSAAPPSPSCCRSGAPGRASINN